MTPRRKAIAFTAIGLTAIFIGLASLSLPVAVLICAGAVVAAYGLLAIEVP